MVHVSGKAEGSRDLWRLRISGDSDKRIRAALVIIDKLRRSLKANPDHFRKDAPKLTGRELHDYREEMKQATKKRKREAKDVKIKDKEREKIAGLPVGHGEGRKKGKGGPRKHKDSKKSNQEVREGADS